MFKYFKRQLKIGIIGCGAIGTILAKKINNDIDGAIVVALSDLDKSRANTLAEQLSGKKGKVKAVDIDKLVVMSDLVIEAASKGIVKEVVTKCISKKRDVMCMSVGGFIGNEGLLSKAEEKNCNVYLPSGAIAGLDGVKAAAVGKIKSVTLTTTKPPKSLDGYENAKTKKVVYEGNVIKAVKLFPKNINVSASLSLAGIGAKNTNVKIVVDPNTTKNTHEIVIEGDFGKITTKTENVPSPLNPKTSYLAILSAIAMVKRIVGKIEVGS
ncbi:aspartate dehydrogenase [Candidatus Woesearchaeota archaeon]|jgi:aspartate dehydrogenase|nr:aspartate dehydrogenase [Candidatus Woesearchaeota archaeon]